MALSPVLLSGTSAKAWLDSLPQDEMMPTMFIGHGNPMNAIEKNAYHLSWQSLGNSIRKPKAIMVVSAHWETRGTFVTSAPRPETIHDFYGFPQALFDARYPAPGSPELAKKIHQEIAFCSPSLDEKWGLDHGTWSILKPMFPLADIPVIQLSLNTLFTPEQHYHLAQELAKYRHQGVLIIGSGNIVHNLGMIKWGGKPYEWASAFDQTVKSHIQDRNHQALIKYSTLSPDAKLAIPTAEHYLPLLYILGLMNKEENIEFFNEGTDLGSVSMTSFVAGQWKK